jgi:hypothetical protein
MTCLAGGGIPCWAMAGVVTVEAQAWIDDLLFEIRAYRLEKAAPEYMAFVRQRVFELCGKALSSELAIDDLGDPSLYQIRYAIPFLTDHLGGCWCGSSALIFREILAALGCRAACIDFGIPDTSCTHISVIAELCDGRWQLHDPYFNIASQISDPAEPNLQFVVSKEANSTEQFGYSLDDEYRAYGARYFGEIDGRHLHNINFTVAEFFRLNATPSSIARPTPIATLNAIFEKPFAIRFDNEFGRDVFARIGFSAALA